MQSERLVELVGQQFGRAASVVAGYVFGSRAAGTSGPRSDLDVAVIFASMEDEQAFWEKVRLKNRLEDELSMPVDVLDMERIPPSLAQEILVHGELILDRDVDHRVAVETRVRREYWDVLPYRRRHRTEVIGRRCSCRSSQ